MAFYTVYLPEGRRDADALEQAVLVADRFSWTAFIFSGLWLLWHRLWLGFAGYLVLAGLIALVSNLLGLGPRASFGLEALLALAVGFEGNSLRAWKLERHGFRLAGTVAARDLERAERRAFAALIAPDARGMAAREMAIPARPLPPTGREPDIIGLFPTAGGRS
jgi:hypothetical protein